MVVIDLAVHGLLYLLGRRGRIFPARLQITLSQMELNSEAVDDSIKAAHSLLGWYRSCMYELAEIKDEDFIDFYAAGLE